MTASGPDPLDGRLRRLAEALGDPGGPPLEEELHEEAVRLARELRDEVRRVRRREEVYLDTVRERNAEYERKVRELSILRRIGDTVAVAVHRADLPERILDVLLDGWNADTSYMTIADRETGELRPAASRSRGGSSERDPFGESVADRVATGAEPLIVDDVARDLRFKHRGEGGRTPGSIVCVPLRSDERVVGALYLASRERRAFVARDLRLLTIVASQVAGAMVARELHEELRALKDRLEDEVQQRTRELEQKTRDLRRKNDEVTELYRSLENAQRELEERNRDLVRALSFNDNVVETINVGICVVDHERRVVTWNRALEQITGGQLSKETTLRRPLEEIPGALRDRFALGATLDDALRLGRPVHRHDHTVDLPSGRTLHLNVHHLPVSLDSERNHQVITVIEDVTDNVELHEEQVKAERLSAINETMVSVNHEVNNPLAVILGYTQMRLRRLAAAGDGPSEEPGPESVRRDLRKIEGEALRIREITKKLSSLVEPVVTTYPGDGGVKMVDLERSRYGNVGSGNPEPDGG